MTTRIEYILLLARDTLNDHKKQRWSDETLIRNMGMAIQDIAKQSSLFKNIVVVPLKNGHGTYQLPDGLLTLSHVTYGGIPLPLRSSGWMNANKMIDWRLEGVELPDDSIEIAVFDEVKRKELAVYPKPFGDFVTPYVSLPNEYGLVGGIYDYTQPSPYGVIAELVDSDIAEERQTTAYGVVTGLLEEEALTIYFSECPALPTDINSELPLDSVFDPALKFYICGIALRNDIDANNRNMASEEFKLYERDLDSIIDLAHTDSVSAPNFESHYNPMG